MAPRYSVKNIILGVSVVAFEGEIWYLNLWVRKADHPPQCRQDPPDQQTTLMEWKAASPVSERNSFHLPWPGTELFSSLRTPRSGSQGSWLSDRDTTKGSPEYPDCWLHILGLVRLHHHVSEILRVNLFLFIYT